MKGIVIRGTKFELSPNSLELHNCLFETFGANSLRRILDYEKVGVELRAVFYAG
jgi:hypothetical protein